MYVLILMTMLISIFFEGFSTESRRKSRKPLPPTPEEVSQLSFCPFFTGSNNLLFYFIFYFN